MARGSETRDVELASGERRLHAAHALLRQVVGAGDAASALQRLVSQKAAVQYLAESVTTSKLAAAHRQVDRGRLRRTASAESQSKESSSTVAMCIVSIT